MKGFLNFFCILTISCIFFDFTTVQNDLIHRNEDQLSISPLPANNYLDVRVNQEKNDNDTLRSMLPIQVVILNHDGVMVYSSTKSSNHFSIFTGGLPEGEYDILCKVGKVSLNRRFVIKH